MSVSKLVVTAISQASENSHEPEMKRLLPTLRGSLRVAGGVILAALSTHALYSGIKTIKTPGPYPYETPVQVPVPPPVLDSSPLPSPAPFPYFEPSPPPAASQDHDARTAASRHPVSAKSVREAAFRYNGVSHFCGFLAALPANVSVYDPELGRPRALVQAGHVVRKNVVWLHKHKDVQEHKQDSTDNR